MDKELIKKLAAEAIDKKIFEEHDGEILVVKNTKGDEVIKIPFMWIENFTNLIEQNIKK